MKNKNPVLAKDVLSDMRTNFPQMVMGTDCIYDRNYFQDVKITTKKENEVYVLLFPIEKEKPSYLEGFVNAIKPEYYDPVHNFEVGRVEISGIFPRTNPINIPGCETREYRGFPRIPDKGWKDGGLIIERKLEPGTFTTENIVAETRRIMNAV